MLVAGAGREPTLLDFFVQAPTRARTTARRPSCTAIDVSFGDAAQVFHIGPASCGVYGDAGGRVRGGSRAGERSRSRSSRRRPRELAREGVVLNAGQAYVAEILADLLTLDAASAPRCGRPTGSILREGELLRNPELGDALRAPGARRRRRPSTEATSRRRSATGCARAAAR